MATITITVDGGAAGSATKTFTLSNANVGRIVAWSKARNPTPGGQPPTNADALEQWAQWMIDMTKAHLVEDERRRNPVPNFDVTA